MKRKIIVEYAERWASGGIESYLLNLVKRLDREKFEIHIVVAQKETDIYDKELAEYGVKVESLLPDVCNNPIKRMLLNQAIFRKYFAEQECNILHLHICQGVALRYAKIAKKIGISKVISHCHNSEFGDGHRVIKLFGHRLGKVLYRKYVDQMLACSDLAAEWLYCKSDIESGKVIITKYIVEVDKFKFSKEDRLDFRKQYDITDDVVVYLNIGRLNYQKNQIFLLDIFNEILSINKKSKLILIGSGELKEDIHNHADELNVTDDIIFIDKTREISKFMSMSDVFLLPSLFEGNPVVGIEAQASGLICFFSDSITEHARVLSSTEFIELEKNASEWAERIVGRIHNINIEKRYGTVDKMKKEGYDVSKQIAEMEHLYSK